MQACGLQALYEHIVNVMLSYNGLDDNDLIINIGGILIRNNVIVYNNYDYIANNASDAKLYMLVTMLTSHDIKCKLATLARIYNTYLIHVCGETLGGIEKNTLSSIMMNLKCDEELSGI